MSEARRPYLACLRVLSSIQADIIDVGVCKVVPSSGQANVDLARQVDQLWVALAVISNHVVNSCRDEEANFSPKLGAEVSAVQPSVDMLSEQLVCTYHKTAVA